MNFFGIIIDAFNAVFRTENVLFKHISLFALTGFLALNSSNMKTLTSFTSTASDVSNVFFSGLLALVVSIYLAGFTIKFMHNSFGDETPDFMPDIDLNPFGIFLGALPLILLWIVYIVLSCVVAIIPFLGWVLAIVFIPVLSIFLQFVYIAYAKEYRATGLFNLFIPFTFAKYTVGSLFLAGLMFIPVYVVAFVPIVILAVVLVFIMSTASSVPECICSILCGYVGYVVQLVWSYCMVQVYREKVEPNVDLD